MGAAGARPGQRMTAAVAAGGTRQRWQRQQPPISNWMDPLEREQGSAQGEPAGQEAELDEYLAMLGISS